MPKTYTPIATQTHPGGGGVITFSSIPQIYTDLVVVINCGIAGTGGSMYIRLNGDTGTNYSQTFMRGSGSAASSARTSNLGLMYIDYHGPTLGSRNSNYVLQLNSYSNTTTHKTILARTNAIVGSGTGIEFHAGAWRNTAAVTSLTIGPTGGNIFNGSTFTIYGILRA
ncbi:hypothetical protein UFOVP696_12 [uncultured Caudovirales phage]|uniref:Uncharacterized protein n=1 Tax=uncultured Caudovirales phage TaxID=2100421 RepID=A0A6J5MKT6_9CAUD|nr:hypothetical protein UFOVP429_1 [uncultured Caudovirales phage]CAB4158117.1 hypothetical protein UFOVP696_12 [uncultured Caudovirales phage]